MSDDLGIKQLEEQLRAMKDELDLRKHHELINRTLFNISKTVSETSDLNELFEAIHEILSTIIDTTNFYIALYDKHEDSLVFSYFVDSVDECYPKKLGVSKTASLTAEVVRTEAPLFLDRQGIIDFRDKSGLDTPGCSVSELWLGVPLKTHGEVVGVIAVQSYDNPKLYNLRDVDILMTAADQVANAIERKKMKDELVANEERFRLSMEATNDGLWDWDILTGVVYYSPGCWTMLGYISEQDFLDVSAWSDLIHPKDVVNTRLVNQQCIDGEHESFQVEFRMLTKDSDWKWIQGRGKAVRRDKHGKALRLVGTHKDISDRKRHEESLERRVLALTMPLNDTTDMAIEDLFNVDDIQRLQDVFSSATGVASIITDIHGKPITQPSNFCRLCKDIVRTTEKGAANCQKSDAMLGEHLGAGPIIEQCLSAGLWDAAAAISIGGRHVATWLVGQVRNEEHSIEDVKRYAKEIGADEEEFIKAYREVPVMSKERFEEVVQALTVLAEHLSVSAYQNIQQARFISELKSLEEQTRESSERIQALFSSVNDPILIHPLMADEFGFFTEVNDAACEKYGYTKGEFSRMTVRDITEKDDTFKHNMKDLNQHLLDSGNMVFEGEHKTKSGSHFPVEIHANVVELSGKTQIIAVVRDISKRKAALEEHAKLEGQLNQSQKMESVGRLAGGVAHDFNNMLSVILGHAEMALDEVSEGTSFHNDLLQIQKAAEHSAELTKQLLAFARKQSVVPKVVDVNLIIENLLVMLKRLLGEDIALSWLPVKSLWSIKIDPSQMDQILTNLCVNARDAIKGPGKIVIETLPISLDETYCTNHAGFIPGDYVMISISDNGVGMEKETLPFIFEPFFTTKEIGEGTGLGLATVYGILKQNNGFIYAYSELGVGTSFKLYFPRELEGSEMISKVAEDQQLDDGKETILLVEDESAILQMATKMLEQKGYHILGTLSPLDALQIIDEYKGGIDLLLTDVIMPEMTGRDLQQKVSERYPEMKCIFMSGYTANIIAEQGVLDSEVNFIQKPFSRADFLLSVQKILAE